MMYAFGTCAYSIARDIAVRFPRETPIDLARVFDLVYNMRRYECAPLFRLWKRVRSMNTTEVFEGLSENLRIPVPVLQSHFDVVGVFQRESPPDTVLSRLDYDTWLEQNQYTDAFGSLVATDCPERPPTFPGDEEDHTELFFDTGIACLAMLQLVESGDVPIIVPTPEGTGVVKSAQMVVTRWRIRSSPKLKIPVFVEGPKLAIPISGHYDAGENVTTKIMMLTVTVEFEDHEETYVVNPWSNVTKTPRVVKRSEFGGSGDFEVQDELSASSVQLLRYTNAIEENLRLCWTSLANAPFYTAVPSPWEAISDLCRGILLCGTIREFRSGFANADMPALDRRTCIDLIRATCESHVAHMAARSIASGCGEHVIGTVTVAYGPMGTHAVLYVSSVTKIGTRIRMSHLAIISDYPTEFREFLRENWKETWLDELKFLNAASSILRASGAVHLLPIPCARQYYRDTFTASYISKKQWRLAGCGCEYCMPRRPTILG